MKLPVGDGIFICVLSISEFCHHFTYEMARMLSSQNETVIAHCKFSRYINRMAPINKDLVKNLDELIRTGRSREARETLQELPINHVSEGLALEIAKLCNRCGLPRKVIKLLAPLVYPENYLFRSANASEMAEYGLALCQIGAYPEAQRVFKKINFKEAPRAQLYLAHTFFNKWEYAEALPILETYLKDPSLNQYEKMVGEVNFAAALIACSRFAEATEILKLLLKESERLGHLLLQGNCLDLIGQCSMGQKDFKMAGEALKTAQSILSENSPGYRLLVEKSLAIVDLEINPKNTRSLQKLSEVRAQAVNVNQWSTVRECDFNLARFKRDDNLFLKVFFGTPFAAYRRRLLDQYQPDFELPKTYLWQPIPGNDEGENYFDVEKGVDAKSRQALKFGQVGFRLLQTLASDFYVPFRVATLFSVLFPDEKYVLNHSSQRIYTNLNRIDEWIKENDVPIEIKKQVGGYRLFVTKPYGFLVRYIEDSEVSLDLLGELKKKMNIDIGFSVGDAANVLTMPKRTLNRKINRLIEEGKLVAVGAGRATKYFIAS